LIAISFRTCREQIEETAALPMACDRKSGAGKAAYPFPGNAGFCNDIRDF